jgi:hypothetical protein
MGVLALGLAAVTPASADYAVVKFKDIGYCRAWCDHTAKPWGTSQVLWVSVNSWDVAQTKGTYAMGHKWCKGWDKSANRALVFLIAARRTPGGRFLFVCSRRKCNCTQTVVVCVGRDYAGAYGRALPSSAQSRAASDLAFSSR